MTDSVQFSIQLIDKLTAPAKQMADALSALKPLLAALNSAHEVSLKVPDVGAAMKAATRARKKDLVPPVDEVTAPLAPLKLTEEQLKLLKQQLRDDKLAVTNLSASLRQLKAATEPNAAAIKAVNDQLSAAKNRLAEVQTKLVRSGNAARFGSEGTNRLTTTLRELAEAAGGGSRIGGFVDKVKSLSGPLSSVTGLSSGAAGAIAALGLAAAGATVAVVALGAGIVALAIGGARLAIEAAEAKQDTLDMLEAMLGTEQAANSTYAQLLGITRISAASKEQITTAAQELAAAGIENQQALVGAVRSIAQVESVLKGSGSKIQSVFEKAAQTGKFEINAKKLTGTGVQTSALFEELSKRTGKGVKQVEAQLKAGKISAEVGIAALSAVIDKKFGGVAAKQALDFPVQLQRLHDNFSRLFDGVKVDGFLQKFSEIVDLFDDSTMAGTAMKGVITTIFDGVFRLAEEALPYLKVGLKGLVIIALQIAIAFKPLIAKLRDAFGGDARQGPLTFARTLSLIGRGLRFVIDAGVGLATWTPMWKTLGVLIGFAATTIDFMTGSVLSLTRGLISVGLAGFMILDWLRNLVPRAIEAGSALVSGLAQGLTNAASVLYDTVTGLAGKALQLFKQKFGIASPSKVMMGMGVNLSLGLAQGIKAGAPVANDNMMRAVSPPRAMAAQTATARSFVVQIEKIEISGVAGVAELGDRVSEVLSDIFERVALTEGRGAAA